MLEGKFWIIVLVNLSRTLNEYTTILTKFIFGHVCMVQGWLSGPKYVLPEMQKLGLEIFIKVLNHVK